jgi:hypothetical protein
MTATRRSTAANPPAPAARACLAAAMAAALLAGCGGSAARLDAQVGAVATTADLPTAWYDLDELNTLTLTLYGRSDAAGEPGRYWYVLLAADLSRDTSAVTVVRECLYLTGSDNGAVLYSSPDVRIAVRVEDRLLSKRLRGTIEGRLTRVAGLGDAPQDTAALLKIDFVARLDSLKTFHLFEEHSGLIQRLRERRAQLMGGAGSVPGAEP